MKQTVRQQQPVARHPVRKFFIPIGEVEAGMELGEPVVLAERNIVRFSLPVGHALTEGNLRKLAARHATVGA